MPQPLPLLTIAGSDSGGAAGAQADLKTWAALSVDARRVYGMSAITAVTAQNSARVAAVHFLPPAMIAAQIDAVLSDYGAAAIKTGFLGRVEIVAVVAERLAYWAGGGLATRPTIVVDPVLVNHRGEAMFPPEVAAAYRALLFPLADLVTPNLAEAVLLGIDDGLWTTDHSRQPRGVGNETPTAAEMSPLGGRPFVVPAGLRVLVKGARRTAEAIVDVYADGEHLTELSQPYIDTINTHGGGDTLSAVICAYRAMGRDWPSSIRQAQMFTHAAIKRAATWKLGRGHGPVAL